MSSYHPCAALQSTSLVVPRSPVLKSQAVMRRSSMLTSSRTTPSAIRVAHIEKRRGVRLAAFLVGHKLLLVRQHSVAAILHLAQRFWLRSSEGSRGITGYPQGPPHIARSNHRAKGKSTRRAQTSEEQAPFVTVNQERLAGDENPEADAGSAATPYFARGCV